MPADRLVRPTTARGLQIAAAAVSEVRVRPRLRGVVHQYAFFVSLASGTLLVIGGVAAHFLASSLFALPSG